MTDSKERPVADVAAEATRILIRHCEAIRAEAEAAGYRRAVREAESSRDGDTVSKSALESALKRAQDAERERDEIEEMRAAVVRHNTEAGKVLGDAGIAEASPISLRCRMAVGELTEARNRADKAERERDEAQDRVQELERNAHLDEGLLTAAMRNRDAHRDTVERLKALIRSALDDSGLTEEGEVVLQDSDAEALKRAAASCVAQPEPGGEGRCLDCGGHGSREAFTARDPWDEPEQQKHFVDSVCPTCHGTGKRAAVADPKPVGEEAYCSICGGKGKVSSILGAGWVYCDCQLDTDKRTEVADPKPPADARLREAVGNIASRAEREAETLRGSVHEWDRGWGKGAALIAGRIRAALAAAEGKGE